MIQETPVLLDLRHGSIRHRDEAAPTLRKGYFYHANVVDFSTRADNHSLFDQLYY